VIARAALRALPGSDLGARIAAAWPDALRMVAAALVSFVLAAVLRLPDGYWAVLTALIVTRPSAGSTARAGAGRLVATLAGAGFAVLVSFGRHWHIPEPALLTVALVPLGLLVAVDGRYRTAPIAAIIVLSAGSAFGSPVLVALMRVAEIALGACVGLGMSALVLPGQRVRRTRRQAAALIAQAGQLFIAADDGAARALQSKMRRGMLSFAADSRPVPWRRPNPELRRLTGLLMRVYGDVGVATRTWRGIAPARRGELAAAWDDLAAAFAALCSDTARALRGNAPVPEPAAFARAIQPLMAGPGDAADDAAAALPFVLRTLRDDTVALIRLLAK
jgi:uncharacterized membrane protein YccC